VAIEVAEEDMTEEASGVVAIEMVGEAEASEEVAIGMVAEAGFEKWAKEAHQEVELPLGLVGLQK
tara:strand:+ start:160 stop:354 length:195 start_codon:yes stop_codon:yes gene_type:complete